MECGWTDSYTSEVCHLLRQQCQARGCPPRCVFRWKRLSIRPPNSATATEPWIFSTIGYIGWVPSASVWAFRLNNPTVPRWNTYYDYYDPRLKHSTWWWGKRNIVKKTARSQPHFWSGESKSKTRVTNEEWQNLNLARYTSWSSCILALWIQDGLGAMILKPRVGRGFFSSPRVGSKVKPRSRWTISSIWGLQTTTNASQKVISRLYNIYIYTHTYYSYLAVHDLHMHLGVAQNLCWTWKWSHPLLPQRGMKPCFAFSEMLSAFERFTVRLRRNGPVHDHDEDWYWTWRGANLEHLTFPTCKKDEGQYACVQTLNSFFVSRQTRDLIAV